VKRIAIVGCGGAGKSVLAQELGRRTGIEVVHLDALYWDADWRPTPPDEWAELQRRLVERDAWIIDGNYGATMDLRLPAADTVIFLDLPTHVCLRRILVRRIMYRRRDRPDRVGSERLTLRFLRWVWSYRRERRPGVLRRLASLGPRTRVITLSSRGEVRDFLTTIHGSAGGG
jgi:adenylate kinase family enzyme